MKTLFTLLSFCMLWQLSAQDIQMDINVFPPYPVEIDYYLDHADNLLLNVSNTGPDERELFFGLRISSDNGLVISTKEGLQPVDPYLIGAGMTESYFGSDWGLLEVDYSYPSDFDVSGMTIEEQSQLLINRILPEGNYTICMQAFDYNTGQLVTEDCSPTFFVEYATVPRLITPTEGTDIDPEANPTYLFSWEPPGNSDAPGDIEYLLEVIDLSENEAVNQDLILLFDDPTVPRAVEEDGLVTTFLDYDILSELAFIEGNTYAVRVTASDPTGQEAFQNGGRSEIVTFTYGWTSSQQVPAILPYTDVDTLPFRYVPLIAQHENYSSSYESLSYELILDLTQPDGSVGSAAFSGTQEWPSGPKVYLRDLIGEAVSQEQAMTFAFNGRSDQAEQLPSLQRGADIHWSLDYEITDSDGRVEYATAESTYQYGMPTPQLYYPVHEQAYLPGEVLFQFQTGETPSPLLPEHLQYLASDAGGVETLFPEGLREKWVLQIAQSPSFKEDSLVFVHHDLIEWESEEQLTEAFLSDTVFTIAEYTTSLDSSGTYFWRVLWLNDPDREVDSLSVIPDTAYYRSSPVWSFSIDEEATVSGDNELTDCDFDCYYTDPISETPASDMTAFSELHIGQFTVENLTGLSLQEDKLKGSGIITLHYTVMGVERHLRVKVAFDNLLVNADGRVYAGQVAAEEDTSFDLTDINQNLSDLNEKIPDAATDALSTYLSSFDDVNAAVFNGTQDLGLPVGFHLSLGGTGVQFGFTEMTFTPTQANCKAVAIAQLGLMNNFNLIPFGGRDICMTPTGFGSEFLLYLAQDISIAQHQADGDGSVPLFALKGSNGSDNTTNIKSSATYVEMDCEGLKGVSVRGEVTFPRSLLVPEDAEGKIKESVDQRVKGTFAFSMERGTTTDTTTQEEVIGMHGIAEVDIDPFQIAGFEGWGFEVNQAYFDFSDFNNPTGMTFPEVYDSLMQEDTWRGLYIKDARLKSPVGFQTDGRSFADVRNIIIDPQISLDLEVTEVMEIGEGSIDGWGFSIDTVQLVIAANTFEEASMVGYISTPIMGDSSDLKYRALIDRVVLSEDTVRTDYNFTIVPFDTVQMPSFLSRTYLNPDSYLTLNYAGGNGADSTDTYLDLFLSGTLNLDAEKFLPTDYDGSAPAAVPILPGAEFQLSYHSQDGLGDSYFDFVSSNGSDNEEGASLDNLPAPDELSDTWAAIDEAYPLDLITATAGIGETAQNLVSGFPVTIEDVGLNMQGNQLSLSLTPLLALQGDEDGFSISTTLKLNSTINPSLKNPKFKFKNVQVECVMLDAAVANMEMGGELCFYNDRNSEGVGDKGVRGVLNLMVPGIGLGVNLEAEFGTRIVDAEADFGTEDNFGYWRTDGLFYLGSAGIPVYFLTIHGLGGGVAVNMRETAASQAISASLITNSAVMDSTQVKGDVDLDQVQGSGKEWEPHFGARAVSFTTVLAVVRQELVNMDLTIGASWQQGEGLQSISLGGDVYIMTPIADRPDAQLRADTELTWYFVEAGKTSLEGTMDFYLDMELLKGAYPENKVVTGNFHAQTYGGENGKGYWDLDFGTYEEPGLIEMNLGTDWVQVQGATYMIAGHHVPTALPPLPPAIQDLLDGGTSSEGENTFAADEIEEEDRPADDIEEMATGLGIAHGNQFNIDLSVNYAGIFADLDVTAGFDMNITHDENRVCYVSDGTSVEPGYNGWYGTGQVYAGLSGNLGLQVKIFGDTTQVKLMELGAAIALQGGAMAPSWVEGRATVSYNVLNGTVTGSHRMPIAWGERCIPSYGDPLANIDFIAETYPADQERRVSPYTEPVASFHLPLDEVIYVPTTDAQGNEVTAQFKPYLDEFSVADASGTAHPVDSEHWNPQHTEVTNRTTTPFAARQGNSPAPRYEMLVRVKAKHKQNGSWVNLQVDGSDWEEVREVSFRTGRQPDSFDESLVQYTIPLNRHRNFLQEEVKQELATAGLGNGLGSSNLQKIGEMKFYQDMSGFFPSSDEDGTYEYFLRFRANGREDVDAEILSNTGTHLKYALPELANETIYAVQLIRKNTSGFVIPPGMADMAELIEQGMQAEYANTDSEQDQYVQWQVASQASAIDRSQLVEPDETLVYVWFFRTSAYDRLNEKVADLSAVGSSTNLVFIDSEERFDEYDIEGFYDKYDHPVAPRVQIRDPFISDYHDDVLEDYFFDPIAAYENQMASNPLIYSNKRYSQLPLMRLNTSAWDVDWAGDPQVQFSADNYQNPLADALISSEFSGLEGMSDWLMPDGMNPGTNLGNTGGSDLLYFSHLTPSYAHADADQLEDWMMNLLNQMQSQGFGQYYYPYQAYFEDHYPAFLSWYNDLSMRGNRLTRTGYENYWSQMQALSGNSGPGKPSPGTSAHLQWHLEWVGEKGTSADFSQAGSSATLSFEY